MFVSTQKIKMTSTELQKMTINYKRQQLHNLLKVQHKFKVTPDNTTQTKFSITEFKLFDLS